jgi:type VI secretion system secreted protein VgrG
MSTTQADRLIRVSTPLGKDALFAVGFTGREAISEPFRFTLDLRAERATPVSLDKLVGNAITVEVEIAQKKTRHFHGICWRAEQGESDKSFTTYRLEIVPQFWVLSKTTRSRIFQQLSVPDILKKVLSGGGVEAEYKLNGTYNPRDYCVQYRESDFNFCSRLMEEEGIFFFFKHTAGGHTMVVSDNSQSHPAIPTGPEKVKYKSPFHQMAEDADVITQLAKAQQLATGKFTTWDHTFEMPHKNQSQEKAVLNQTNLGKVSHKIKPPTETEWYDWPGGYAKRYAGIDKGGGEQAGELNKIAKPDGERVIAVRAEREAAASVAVFGTSDVRHFTSGHKFTIDTIPTDYVATPIRLEGEYVLTEVTHSARVGDTLRSGSNKEDAMSYSNSFVALPKDVTFRPARVTPKPVVPGSQSAQVVGPAGEEIFIDKYGRVKVQFHWDREGKRDADSSCWVRVAWGWAGRHWGMMSVPRIGQEVLVDYLEGDPDKPIIVGSVYNPNQMPVPHENSQESIKTRSYWKSNSTPGGVGYNMIRFEDKAGSEQVYVHAQRNMDERVRSDSMERVGNDRHLRVGFFLANDHKGDTSGETKQGNQYEEVAVDQHLKVHKDKYEHVGGSMQLLVGGGDGDGNLDIHVKKDKKELIDGTSDLHVKGAVTEKNDGTYDLTVGGKRTETVGPYDLHVKGDFKEKTDGAVSLTVGSDYQEKAGGKHAVEAGQEIHLKAGMKVILEAGMQITLKGPGGFVDIGPTGVTIQGTMVLINSGGAAGSGSGSSPAAPSDAKAPKDAADANPKKPTDADYSKTGEKSN